MNGLLFHTVLGILPFFREYKKCVCVGNILLNYNVSFSFMVFLMIYRNIEINIPNYVHTTLVFNTVISQIFCKYVNYCKCTNTMSEFCNSKRLP